MNLKRILTSLLAVGAVGGCTKSESDAVQPVANGSAEERAVVELTPAAAKELRRRMPDGLKSRVRFSVSFEESDGFRYGLKFDDAVDKDNDYISSSNGLRIVVDKQSAPYLDGTVIDWESAPGQVGFSFNNPNAVKIGD